MRLAWLAIGLLGLVGTQNVSAKGLDAAELAQIDTDIKSGKFGNIDSLLILRHGAVVFDHAYKHDYHAIYGEDAKKTSPLNAHDPGGPYNYFNPWWHPFYRDEGELHSLQSVTKTITSIVVGVATTRGDFPSLDTPVLKFFDESKVQNIDDRKRHLTIRNLITMTVGMKWNADVPYNDPNNAATNMEASPDWVQFFINQPMQEEPGTRFYYNDGAPQTLSHIFQVATGRDMEEYAAKHLFQPLGIKHWFWKRTPSGLPDTEGGLYLDRHDLAKLMTLFQKDGIWDGKRIISTDWVKASIAPAVTANEKTGAKYGYLWWLTPYAKDDPRMAFGGRGFGGQLPIVMPDHDVVIVVNGWDILDRVRKGKESLLQRVMTKVAEEPI